MKNIFKAYAELQLVEETICVAMAVNEIAQMARIEKRLYELYVKTYDALVVKASTDAGKLRAAGKTAKQIRSSIDRTMAAWAGAVGGVSIKELKRTYQLGRQAGAKRAEGKIKKPLKYPAPENVPVAKATGAFDLVDDAVVQALNKHQIFWIGEFYETGVSDGIAEVVKDNMIQEGVSAKVAGEIMSQRVRDGLNHVELPTGWRGTSRQYMEGLTANAMTTARVHGQMRSFAEIGIQRYKISNPSDKRTCSRCSHMEGKTFTLKQGMDQLQADMDAKSPEDVRNTHPWLSRKQIVAVSPTPGPLSGKAAEKDSNALSEAGQALPTYHFKCRCTVDVDYESVDYESLGPVPMSVAPSPIKRYKTAKSWANSLDKQHANAFRSWTRRNYGDIRRYQLGGDANSNIKYTESIKQSIAEMRESLTKSPFYKKKIMRGIANVATADVLNNFKIGNLIRNDAFSSWSKKEHIAKSFATDQARAAFDSNAVLLELVPSKGAFDIELLSVFQSEGEVLMEQGKMMKVIGLKKETIGVGDRMYNLYRVKLEEAT